MKLETFFEKFDLLVEAQDAVPRMRRLILDLAVRGRLVAQDPKDEPADQLMKRIQGEKNRLIGSGEIKKQERLPPVADDAISFAMPDGWAISQLGDVAVCLDYMREPINGTERGLRIAGKQQSELFPYFGATQQQGWIDDFIFDAELVLLGEDGVPFFDGFRAKAYLISGKTWVNNHAHVFRGVLISNPFLVHWLNTFDYTGRVAGSTRSKLNQAKALDIPIALPPLAEQKRIVAKVDELMALCDRLEAQQQEREARHATLARASLARFADAPTSGNLEFIFHKSYIIAPADLRKTILTLAVQGRLVPQEPNDEPAVDALARVLRERSRLDKSLRVRNPFPVQADGEHTPRLPIGWCYASPDQMTAFHKNALTIGPFGSSLLKSDYTAEGVPLVFVRDIRSECFGGAETRFVSAKKANELASHSVRPGDLLITKMGDPPGDTSIYPEDRPEAIITADCIKLTTHRGIVSAEYLRFAIRASQTAEQFAGITLGVAQQKVSLGRFRCIAIPLPPLAEQARIVVRVKQVMTLVDGFEVQLDASRAAAANLLDAVVCELTSCGQEY